MRVIAVFVRSFVLLLAAAAGSAQVQLGDPLAKAEWQGWVQGVAVPTGGELAPACTVYAFYTQTQHQPSFATDADYLAELQKRFAEAGLVVVAVVGADKPAAAERWAGCRIAQDGEMAVTQAWLGGGELPWHLLVADRDGKVRFLGEPAAGLVDAIDATLKRRDTLAGERSALSLRYDLPPNFDDATAEVVQPLVEWTTHAPRDGLGLGLLYLTYATKANDAGAAKQVLERAIVDLASESRPLAAFADLALRGDPRRPGLAAMLRPALHVAAAAAPNDVFVQLAFLRALVLAGDEREVGRQSMKLRKLVTATAEHCLEFATILAAAGNAPVHRDLATMALDKAATLGAGPRLLTGARYAVAVRCANDIEASKRLLDEYLKDTELRVSINNDCWYLMTEVATMGRFDVFAAGLAERMLEQKEGMDYFEFDTAALAMFLVGRFAEAVSLQETAIEKGGKGNPQYTERLNRYKAGVPQPPK